MRLLGRGLLDALSSTLSGNLQHRLIDYALKKFLGAYVKNDLSRQDIDLQLRNGILSFNKLDLRTEAINARLSGCGFAVEQGSIESLEMSISWSELLLGKVKIVIHGLEFVLKSPNAQLSTINVHDLEHDISESIMDVANSFMAEESAGDVGVSDELPETAVVQRTIDSILANLVIEIAGLRVSLEALDAPSRLLFELMFLRYGPRQDSPNKEITARNLSLSIASIPFVADTIVKQEKSSSSRSTSSSSYDDAELMQSTIFGIEESRSLFMSALEFEHTPRQSVIMDDPVVPTPASRVVFSRLNFSGLITSTPEDMLAVDLSFDSLEVEIDRLQILALQHYFSFFRTGDVSERSEDLEGSPTLLLEMRFASIHCRACLENDSGTASRQKENPSSTIDISLHRVALMLSSQGQSTLDIPSFGMSIGKESLSDVKGLDFHCQWSNPGGVFCVSLGSLGLNVDIDGSMLFLENMRALANEMFKHDTEIPVRKLIDPVDTKEGLTQSMTINCPKIDLQLCLEGQTILFAFHNPTLNWLTSTPRSRATFGFTELYISANSLYLLEIRHETAENIIDYTINHVKPSQPTLEFINYEELFEYTERDHKTELGTMRALKQKSKNVADRVLRASIDRISSRLSIEELRACQTCFNVFRPRLYPVPVSISDGPAHTTTILIEINRFAQTLDCETDVLNLDLTSCSIFAVHNLKNTAVTSIEVSSICLSSSDTSQTSTMIARPGLHLDGMPSHRSVPMLSVRSRRNIAGRRSGHSMIRVGLIDVQLEYFADIPWLKALMRTYELLLENKGSSIPSASSEHPPVQFAVDLTNTSFGLNPYAGKIKGLLYFRRSTLGGYLNTSAAIRCIQMQAGVLDLFLTDNIDSGQHNFPTDKRSRNDPLSATLFRLGFVKVVGAETVEISLHGKPDSGQRAQYVLDVVGAILTIGTCADSLATLSTLLNMLRIPITISDELKFKLGLTEDNEIPLDVFSDIEEDAYKSSVKNADSVLTTTAEDSLLSSNATGTTPRDSDTIVNIAGENHILDVNTAAVVDEYFVSSSIIDHRKGRKEQDQSGRVLLSVNLRKCFIVWNIHDGYDWESTRTKIDQAVSAALAKAQAHDSTVSPMSRTTESDSMTEYDNEDLEKSESAEIGDLLFNSIYIALPNGARTDEVTSAINETIAQVDVSDTATQTTTTQVPTSSTSRAGHAALQLGRSRMHKVRIEISGVDVKFELFDAHEGQVQSATSIKIQDLEIIDNVSTSTWRKFLTYHRGAGVRDNRSSISQLRITGIKPVAGLAAAELAIEVEVAPLRLHVDQDTLEFLTRYFEFKDTETILPVVPAEEVFIQRFEMQAIPIQIDYKPKRVNLKSLRSGRTTELKNLFILEDSNMVLKHVILYGTCGFARIFQHLNDIWLSHIKATQLPGVLAGVSPIRSLAGFGSGLKNLVLLPMSEYQKDGKIMPGLKKGLGAFVKATSNEAVRLGAKLAIGTQGLLETAEHSLSTQVGDTGRRKDDGHAISMYADQPRNLKQGLSQGFGGMTRNVAIAREAISVVPRDLEGETDARGMAMVAARSVPIAVLRPLIGTTEMISKTLLGLRNTMNPEQRKLNEDKYKHAE